MLVKSHHLHYEVRITLRSVLRDTEAEALPQATAREQATQVAMARQKGASGGGGEAAENLAKGEGPGGSRPRRSRSRRDGGHARRRI